MKVRLALFPALVVLFSLLTAALPAPDQPLPVDPQVRIGHLDNGFTYYIRHNEKPESRAELRLVVKAGSVLETDQQQGLAHFLEHMEFNGTEHFQGNDIVSYLESIGARFGADLNAYTSFDRTVYKLQIPTDKKGLLQKGILILSDWAHTATLDSAEVNKERGVILEEWRLGRGAMQRVRNIQWPVLFQGSRYAERLPIGKPEVIRHATAADLRSFYTKWYQPQLMAVVAVGSFDPDSVESMIRERFGPIPAPPDPSSLPLYEVPSHADTLVSVATDKELPIASTALYFLHPRQHETTVGDYRRDLAAVFCEEMLNARLMEIALRPDPPFLMAATGEEAQIRPTSMFQAFAVTAEDGMGRGLRALATEIQRVRDHGFGKEELERSKARLLAQVEKQHNERNKTASAVYARQCVEHFLLGESMPGDDFEYGLDRDLISAVTLEEVNEAVDRLISPRNMVILAAGPDKKGAVIPPADTLLAFVRGAGTAGTAAYVDTVATGALLPEPPAPGRVVRRQTRSDLGMTVLTFSNGAQAWLKPTDFKNDEILFGARARGGTSLADSAMYPSASVAAGYVTEAGFGGFSATDLQKKLSGKIVDVSPRIGIFDQGVRGSCTPKDLETALQVLYLVVTEPNDRPDAFTSLKQRMEHLIENMGASPEARFSEAVMKANFQDHYMMRMPTQAMLDRLDRGAAFRFYRERMAGAGSWRFYFVGSFQPEEIEPLLARYLGSLPSVRGPAPRVGDPGFRFPKGIVSRTVRAGHEPKSLVQITWPAVTHLKEMEMFLLRAAGDVLRMRLRKTLREDLGETYSARVSFDSYPPYTRYGTTGVSFGCAPDNTSGLTARVLEIVRALQTEGPTDEETAKVKEQRTRSLEKSLKRNGYWLGSLLSLDVLGWDPGRILHRRTRIEAITPQALRGVMARYYPRNNYTVVTLLPAKAVGAGADSTGSRQR